MADQDKEKRSLNLQIRVSPTEKEQIEAWANRKGFSDTSNAVRVTILERARQDPPATPATA